MWKIIAKLIVWEQRFKILLIYSSFTRVGFRLVDRIRIVQVSYSKKSAINSEYLMKLAFWERMAFLCCVLVWFEFRLNFKKSVNNRKNLKIV